MHGCLHFGTMLPSDPQTVLVRICTGAKAQGTDPVHLFKLLSVCLYMSSAVTFPFVLPCLHFFKNVWNIRKRDQTVEIMASFVAVTVLNLSFLIRVIKKLASHRVSVKHSESLAALILMILK